MPTAASRRAAALVLGLGALAGCGNAKTPAPDVAVPGPPLGQVPGTYPASGVGFDAPAGWTSTPGVAPLVVTVTTGEAAVAIYRYPRDEPLPTTSAGLDAAADAIVSAATQRDPSFKLLAKGRLRVAGAPAVVVRGTETILGAARTVRSTHVYEDGAEIVVDALAPAADFKRVDAQVFRPLVRSLKLTVPGATGPSGATGASAATASTAASAATGTT